MRKMERRRRRTRVSPWLRCDHACALLRRKLLGKSTGRGWSPLDPCDLFSSDLRELSLRVRSVV